MKLDADINETDHEIEAVLNSIRTNQPGGELQHYWTWHLHCLSKWFDQVDPNNHSVLQKPTQNEWNSCQEHLSSWETGGSIVPHQSLGLSALSSYWVWPSHSCRGTNIKILHMIDNLQHLQVSSHFQAVVVSLCLHQQMSSVSVRDQILQYSFTAYQKSYWSKMKLKLNCINLFLLSLLAFIFNVIIDLLFLQNHNLASFPTYVII